MDEELRNLREQTALGDQAKRDGEYVAAVALRQLTQLVGEATIGRYGKVEVPDGEDVLYRRLTFLAFTNAMARDEHLQDCLKAVSETPLVGGILFGKGLENLMKDIRI